MNNNWKWFGHAGHFIGAKDCYFRMCTQVGNYLISSVGEYLPRGEKKPVEIGADRRTYETMVFNLNGNDECECGCGLPKVEYLEIDMMGYTNAKEARAGHIKMCYKWDNIQDKSQ